MAARRGSLSRPSPIRHRSFRHREHGFHSISEANVEQHTLGKNSTHFPGLQIHDEQGLLAFNLTRIGSLLLDASDDGSRVIAKIYPSLAEFLRSRHIGNRFDRAHPYIQLFERIQLHGRLNRGWRHHGSFKRSGPYAAMTFFWNRRAAAKKSKAPIIVSISPSNHKCLRPAPRRIIPRVMLIK